MIDTHNHLLPGLDDGAQNLEESLRMCRIAFDDGIRCVVATPHAFDCRFFNSPATIRQLIEDLNAEIKSQGIELNIVPGMEVRVVPELAELLTDRKVLTMNNGSYVLLEFHPSQIPVGFRNLVLQLMKKDYRVVLAHPEKNAAIQSDPDYVFNLLREFDTWQFLVQVSADSILGQSGTRARRVASLLLKHNLAHLIASDAHSSGARPPRLSSAVEAAARLVGMDRARQMVEDVPNALLEGNDFPPAWEPLNPRRWWRFF